MKHLMTLMALVVAVTAGAQGGWPYNPDSNSDNVIGSEDLLSLLPLYGTEFQAYPQTESNILLASQDGCTDWFEWPPTDNDGDPVDVPDWIEVDNDTLFIPYGYTDFYLKSSMDCNFDHQFTGSQNNPPVLIIQNPYGYNEGEPLPDDSSEYGFSVFSPSGGMQQYPTPYGFPKSELHIHLMDESYVRILTWDYLAETYVILDDAWYENQNTTSDYWYSGAASTVSDLEMTSRTYILFGTGMWHRLW